MHFRTLLCKKCNGLFAGSGGLQCRVALFAGQHTQGATQYTKDVYTKQFGMEMLQLQESFWRQRKSDRTTMQPTKPGNPNGKGKETKRNEKMHTTQFETVQQEMQDNKSGKTHGSGVALTEIHETERKVNMIIGHCKHCGRNDH